MKKIILAGVVMALAASMVLAEGIDVIMVGAPNIAYLSDRATPVPTGANKVQVIRGPVRLPAPNADQLHTDDTQIDLRGIGEVRRGVGEFEVYYRTEAANTPVFIRVWPDGVARGNRYGTSGQGYASSSGNFPTPWSVGRINCVYLAEEPLAPTIDRVDLTYVERAGSLVGVAAVYITPDAEHEVNNYEIEIRLESAPTGLFTRQGGSPVTTNPDEVIQRLALSTRYEVRARAQNYYGWSSAWSAYFPFRTASAGVGGAGGVYDVNIERVDDDTVKIKWKATPGLVAFNIYHASDVSAPTVTWDPVTAAPAYDAGTQYYSINQDFTIVPLTKSTEYWRVVPAGAVLTESPRDLVGRQTYVLDTSRTGLGINSIAIPFARCYSFYPGATEARLITSALEVESALPAFEYISGWDETRQTEYYYLAGGARGSASFDLKPGIGYQLSLGGTTDTLSWTVIGVK